MSDLYSILGVNRNSSQDEIKQAYRKLAAKHHPDREGGDTKKFQEIQHAYDVLSDPRRKQEYDTPKQAFGGGPAGFHFHAQGFDFQDIFNQFFGQQAAAARSHVYRTTVMVTLEQVYNGGEHILHVQTPQHNQVIKIDIPKGIQDGAQIRYDRLISDAQLIVEFRVHKHLIWERRNQDLILNHSISVLDLIAGTEIEVTTISGTVIVVTVDPCTNPNANLKIAGHGLPIPGTNQYGDLFISMRPTMPQDINPEIISAIVRSRT